MSEFITNSVRAFIERVAENYSHGDAEVSVSVSDLAELAEDCGIYLEREVTVAFTVKGKVTVAVPLFSDDDDLSVDLEDITVNVHGELPDSDRGIEAEVDDYRVL